MCSYSYNTVGKEGSHSSAVASLCNARHWYWSGMRCCWCAIIIMVIWTRNESNEWAIPSVSWTTQLIICSTGSGPFSLLFSLPAKGSVYSYRTIGVFCDNDRRIQPHSAALLVLPVCSGYTHMQTQV